MDIYIYVCVYMMCQVSRRMETERQRQRYDREFTRAAPPLPVCSGVFWSGVRVVWRPMGGGEYSSDLSCHGQRRSHRSA